MESKIVLRGMFRIKIGEEKDGKLKIVGDSGWKKNEVTNLGFAHYIIGCFAPATDGTSKQPTHMQLGTGTEPAAAATSLEGETGARKTISTSIESSKTFQATAEWASGDNPGACTLKNVGLFNTSSGGTLMCGNTYTTSSWGTNQAVSATYQLQFQTTT